MTDMTIKEAREMEKLLSDMPRNELSTIDHELLTLAQDVINTSEMVSDDQVFNGMTNSDPEVDYTGLNAAYYIDQYTNRPEDQGNLQGIQSMLSTAGIVNPAADAINAAIYAVQGEWGMAGLSAAAVIPILGDMHKAKKSAKKMITLYRGYDRWYPGSMVENGKFIGGPGTGSVGSIIGDQPAKSLWTTIHPEQAINYTKGSGPVFKFEVPESYIKNNGIYKSGLTGFIPKATQEMIDAQHKYSIVSFPEGLPRRFISEAFNSSNHFKMHLRGLTGATKGLDKMTLSNFEKIEGLEKVVSPTKKTMSIEDKIMNMMNNPEQSKNFAENMGNVMKENIKKYNR
jgi:hypothetical protein